jgi:protein involved in polysaccharide export with SLBB domain
VSALFSRSLFVGLLLWALTGCLTPRTGQPEAPLPAPEDVESAERASAQASTLGSGDLVEVRVFQEPDLSGVFRIDQDGRVDYPLCGKVRLGGLPPGGAADALRTCLSEGYLRHPQVSVLVKEYNSKKIFVFGEVEKPGTFPYEQDMSIIQAITLAGGFSKTAAENATHVTRLIDGREQRVRVPVKDIAVGQAQNFRLQPGDIVFVPQSFF